MPRTPPGFSVLVDTLLCEDPQGAYAGMDAPTRERYLRTVRHLAAHARAGLDAEGIARVALRRAAVDAGARPAAGHVGYHLVGPGAPALEREVGYHPPPRVRAYRFLWRHPASAYLGLCTGLVLAFLAPVVAYADRNGATAPVLLMVGGLVLPIVAEAAVSLARGLLHSRFPLRVLPKMAFADGIPDEHRTLVVVPTLLRSPQDARRQVARLERMAAENPGPNLRFALLSDFTDASSQRIPGDREIVAAARQAVEQLNARHRSPVGDRFFVLHRERTWNPDEGSWTGWLRKTGKLEELLRLLREPRAETGFRWILGRLPRKGGGVPFRYVITMDESDRLEPGHAADLVRTAAHPLNRPWVDVGRGIVTEGYGMLQPAARTEVETRSRYTDLVHGGPAPGQSDAEPRHKPHFYTDVFGVGQFQGKGLLDVDALRAVLPGVVTPAAVLSHDVLESFYARAAHVGDVRMVEGPMDRYLVQARVDHRWMRGDCQLVPWLFSRVRDREGRVRGNPVPWTLRLRLLRLIFTAAARPAVLAVLLLGWTVLPGSALVWTAVALSHILLQQVVSTVGRLMAAIHPGRGSRATRGAYLAGVRYQGFRVGVLAHLGVLCGDAVGRGVWRSLVSRKLRTQWVTQRQSAQQPLTLGHYLRTMWPSAALGCGILPLVASTAPERLPVAAPFALLWMAAPLWVWRMDRPLPPTAVVPDHGKTTTVQAAS